MLLHYDETAFQCRSSGVPVSFQPLEPHWNYTGVALDSSFGHFTGTALEWYWNYTGITLEAPLHSLQTRDMSTAQHVACCTGYLSTCGLAPHTPLLLACLPTRSS
jgi:hypothetical protein